MVSSWVHSNLMALVNLGTDDMSFFFSMFFMWFHQFLIGSSPGCYQVSRSPGSSAGFEMHLCTWRRSREGHPAESVCTPGYPWIAAGDLSALVFSTCNSWVFLGKTFCLPGPGAHKSSPKPLHCQDAWRFSWYSCCLVCWCLPALPLGPGGPKALERQLVWAHHIQPIFISKILIGWGELYPFGLHFVFQKRLHRSTWLDIFRCFCRVYWIVRLNTTCNSATLF